MARAILWAGRVRCGRRIPGRCDESGQHFREGAQAALFVHWSWIRHDDTTQRFLDRQFDLGRATRPAALIIPRMREGNLSAIFFSIWMPSKVTGPEAWIARWSRSMPSANRFVNTK